MTTEPTDRNLLINGKYETVEAAVAGEADETPEVEPEDPIQGTTNEVDEDASTEQPPETDEQAPEEGSEEAGEGAEEQSFLEFVDDMAAKLTDADGETPQEVLDAVAERFGVTPEEAGPLIEAYAQGRAVAADKEYAPVYDAAGGKEGYSELLEWASENLSADEIEAFNKTVQDGTVGQLKIAVEGLNARRGTNAEKKTAKPKRTVKGANKSAPTGFSSNEAYLKAVMDPRYETDGEYRSQVMSKLAASNF